MLESTINYNLLEILAQQGYKIIIIKSFGDIQIWNFSKFTPNTAGSDPDEVCRLTGILLTPFLMKLSPTLPNKEFFSALDKYVEEREQIQVVIPKTTEWQQFTI